MQSLIPAVSGLDELSADLVVSKTTVDMFKELLVRLPDLSIYRPSLESGNCWPCSKSVNHIADSVYIHEFKVPGTEDVFIYAWPSTTINNFTVYSDPPSYVIGQVNKQGFGIVPTKDLEEQLDKDNISFKVIRKIRDYLRSKPAIFYM